MYRLPLASPTRRGNAILLAVGLIATAAAIVAVSATSSVSTYSQTNQRSRQIRAMAALEAVLQRAESRVAIMAESGKLSTWTSSDATRPSLGIEYFGDCEVRWRIEPARTPNASEVDGVSLVNYITNPSPDPYYTPQAVGEQLNESVYLYRIAAEARMPVGNDGVGDAVAQGVRYVSVNEEPLFRYVIFYAKEGPKGDLELSHGPGVDIKGGVYSNGAIYFGAGTEVNDWAALSPPTADSTIIGPDENNDKVSVIGVDGMFRMSKPVIYGWFNGLPFQSTNPGMLAGDYQLGGSYPNDGAVGGDTNFNVATSNGTVLNPYRVKNTDANTEGRTVSINGIELTGPGGPLSGGLYTAGTDSRDHERDTSLQWNPASLATTSFNGYARTRLTNARIKRLPDILKNRPFEAQRVLYDEGTDDIADDYDEHLEARPLFITATGQETSDIATAFAPGANGPLESSGQYVRYAFGGDNAYFARRIPFTGWDVLQVDGTKVDALLGRSGLIVRERPLPDTNYFAGGEVQPANISNRDYLPYAYGKHRRPSIWPFTEMWITDGAVDEVGTSTNDRRLTNALSIINGAGTWNINTNAGVALQYYSFGGPTTVIAANNTGHTGTSYDSPADAGGYYRGNARFIHLKNDTTVRAGTSLRADTRANSDFYFDTATFNSLQAKVTLVLNGRAQGTAQGRKVGVMIRGVDPVNPNSNGTGASTELTYWGLNGRQPYAATCFSPERGFFTEYRKSFSKPAPVTAYFTATDAATNGMTVPGTKYIATKSNVVTDANGYNQSTTTVTNFGAVNLSNGEGAWNFAIGPYVRQRVETPYARRLRTLWLRLQPGYDAGFLLADYNKAFTGYTTTYGGATLMARNTDTDTKGTSNTLDDTAVLADPIAATVPQQYESIRFSIYSAQVPDPSGATSATTPVAQQYDDKTIYKGQGQYDTAKSAFIAKGKSEADLIAWLNSKGYTVVSVPSDPNPPNPTILTTTAAEPTDYDFTTPRLFRMSRSTTVDTNSYVSTRGRWFDTAVTQWLSTPAVPTGITPPTTNSFAPDMWTSQTAPTVTSLSTDAGGSVVTNTTGGPTGTTAAWEDTLPAGWNAGTAAAAVAAGQSYWLRLERVPSTNLVQFKYALTTADPPADDTASRAWATWVTMLNPDTGTPVEVDISAWPADMAAGLMVTSGDVNNAVTARFDRITYTDTAASVTGLKADGTYSWEVFGTPNPMTLYLCSQYQVFFGGVEITEDFFLFGESSPTTRLADEFWFYNPREFWSQSRWFNESDPIRANWIEKENGTTTPFAANWTTTTQRMLWARTTVLNLNMGNVQDYLKNRTVTQATSDAITGGSTLTAVTDSSTLAERFSGLFYAARTNRYPWNPTPGSNNPYNVALPNSGTNNYLNLTDTTLTWAAPADRPPLSPPTPWMDFHHGVMISNASSFDWEIDGSGTQEFGTSKSSIATPNRLYVWGDLNTADQLVSHNGTPNTAKIVPLAIMGDQITLLSNNWDPLQYQVDGVTTNNTGSTVTGGILALPKGQPASSTTYRACIVTNNQPTTRNRVMQGQGAPFIDTMLFMENWEAGSSVMDYKGSLVVLDTCRYARNFLLQETKTYGTTPFGVIGWRSDISWGGLGTPDWCQGAGYGSKGSIAVYGPPNRVMTFNLDLLTEEGTPPNTPFGLTATGVGGWAQILR